MTEIPKKIKQLLNEKKDVEKEVQEARKTNPFEEPEPKRLDTSELAEEDLKEADARLSAKYGNGEDLGLMPFPKELPSVLVPQSGGGVDQILGKSAPFDNFGEQHMATADSNINESTTQDIPELNGPEINLGHKPQGFEGSNPSSSDLLQELEEERLKNEALRNGYRRLASEKDIELPENFWDESNLPMPQESDIDEMNAKAFFEQRLREVEANNASLKQQLQQVLATRPSATPAPIPWKGKNVRILFPCIKTTNPLTTTCIAAFCGEFGFEKVGFNVQMGDSMVYHARNMLADRFMSTESEWSFWIDDDMVLPFGQVEMMRENTGITAQEIPDRVFSKHAIKDLLKHNQKIIAGTYFGRRKISPPMFRAGIDQPFAYRAAKTADERLIATDWAATGCLLVHRDVYKGIQAKFPQLAPTPTRTYWDYFLPGFGFDNGQGGEDESFCRRAKEAGFQVYVDTGVQCLHVGACAYGMHNTIYPRFEGGGSPMKGDPTKWY